MNKKKVTYTEDNIAIWREADEKSIKVFTEKIRAGDNAELYSLTLAHESLGLTHIALRKYPAALGHFGAAAAVWAGILERYIAGQKIAHELVDRVSGMPFILANAASDMATIRRLRDAYATAFKDATSRNQQQWSGMIVGALSLGNLETARELAASLPDPSKAQTSLALIDHDEKAFADSIARSAETWKEIIRSERLQRFPDAVCNHKSIGWIKLAERVWGKRPNVDLEAGKIPKEIFDVEPELIDPGI